MPLDRIVSAPGWASTAESFASLVLLTLALGRALARTRKSLRVCSVATPESI